MSLSADAISDLAISDIPRILDPLAAAFVAFGFLPQDADLQVGLINTIFAEAVHFSFTPGDATVAASKAPVSIVDFDLPEFDRQTAWTVDFNGVNDLIWFAGYSPNRGAFFVRYSDGNFTLWLGMPQGVMRGLILATNQLQFLHNLGRPFLASFYP